MINRIGSSFRDGLSNRNGHGPIATDKIAGVDKSDTVPREKRISLFLCCLIIFNSIFTPLAQARIVPNRHVGSRCGQTVKEDKKNDTYIINIAAPNGDGISYNSFESFSISADDNRSKKILINNRPKTSENTFTETLKNIFGLNSMVESNPNIRWVDGAASTIIFEINTGESVNLNNSIIELLGGENVTMIFASSRGMIIRETIFRGTASRLDLIAGTIRISDENKLEFNIRENGSMVFSARWADNISLSAPDVEEIRLLGYTMRFSGEIFSREKITINSKADIDLTYGAKLKTGTLDIQGSDLSISGPSSIETRDLRIKLEKGIRFSDRSTVNVLNDMEVIAEIWFFLGEASKIKVGNNFSIDVQKDGLGLSGSSSIETKNLRIKSGRDIRFSDGSTVDVSNDMEATARGWFHLDGGSKIKVGNNLSLDTQEDDLIVFGLSSIRAKNLRIKSGKGIWFGDRSTVDVSNDVEATAGGLFLLDGGSKIKCNKKSLAVKVCDFRVSRSSGFEERDP
ncbi:MAG: hypothetical protein LBI70_00765 [Rickettsiales bacterium]|jgi:hypothetical protein|nr:hypothetical protein [Rickettsiales bacterium]